MVNSVSQQQAQHNNEPQTVHARPESEAQQRDNQAVRNASSTNQALNGAGCSGSQLSLLACPTRSLLAFS